MDTSSPGAAGAIGGAAPKVVLGVSGGIAAYKAVEVCRRLVDAGVHVVPVLTPSATRFVGEVTFSALASEPAQRSLWDEGSPIPHTALGQQADLVLVVPATAHLLARYAAGLADDLLTATLLATRAPVIVCPAMHTEMWEHASVQENLATLRRRGVLVVEPEEGRLAGGDRGAGRLADPASIVARVLEVLRGVAAAGTGAATGSGDLSGHRMAVSAGGTREPLDPVRFLTNRSSGKQGHALAEAAARRGATVTLVTASALPVPPGVTGVHVETAAEMESAMLEAAAEADVVVMAAAVADFRPKTSAPRKLTKDEGIPDLVLEPTPDILAALAAGRRPGQVLVGFAAETDQVRERARRKLTRKAVDLLVVNDVTAEGAGFDHDTNVVTIMGADGEEVDLPLMSKLAVADAVLDRVKARFGQQWSGSAGN
ncbi:MAG TPA: bifunctional phosphopantothenoylcysteine decarboxylase/phosphopantothenate--cysteine ligase CoaBC [Acidimicrobiales bacterium]|nr:bifunctional phosphopantothenoylcysteine decarboxylase/phosphopantothenate--cysteine ligase CoaBC [Acidimicrobiales bacterium]